MSADEKNKTVKISRTDSIDAPLVSVGPTAAESSHQQLLIPRQFEREISFPDSEDAPTLTLRCEFRDELVIVTNLEVRHLGANGITSSLLHSLALPALVHAASLDAIPNVEFWTQAGSDSEPALAVLKTDYGFLAQMYWLEHVTQGSPRQRLMSYLGLPQSTCNVLIRRIKSVYPLPTPRTAHKSFSEAAARKH
jgi:hypothetical protein